MSTRKPAVPETSALPDKCDACGAPATNFAKDAFWNGPKYLGLGKEIKAGCVAHKVHTKDIGRAEAPQPDSPPAELQSQSMIFHYCHDPKCPQCSRSPAHNQAIAEPAPTAEPPKPREEEHWNTPTRWGVTDARVRFALSLFPGDEKKTAETLAALVEEAARCARITALQLARERIADAGADSQWQECIEELIHAARS